MYAKLFTSIYQGTLRGNSNGLLVFTNLLAHADKEGVVDLHPRAIAEEVGLPIESVNLALLMLESPDDESRSPEEEGRRIVRLDEHRAWGWRVVNYLKYRAIRNEDERREQNRQSQARWREKNKPASANVSQSKPRSAKISSASAESAHTEAEVEADTEALREEKVCASRLPKPFSLPLEWKAWANTERPDLIPDKVAEKFADYWTSKPGKAGTKLDWFATWRNWIREEKAIQSLSAAKQTFRERDLAAKQAEVAKWTGGRLGKFPDVIDMENGNGTIERLD